MRGRSNESMTRFTRRVALALFLLAPTLLRAQATVPSDDLDQLPGGAKFVVSSAIDSTGAAWIGTEGQGIWRIANGQATQFTTADGLGDNDAYAIAADKTGRIWVGHSSHGVSVFDGKSHWRNYDVTSGPWGSRVFCIATCPVDGDVWIATEAGLTRYSLQKDSWSNFDRTAGLPANEANALAFNAAGDLFVGLQANGIAVGRRADGYRVWHTTTGPDVMPVTATGTGLPTSLINALLVAHDGTIFAGTTRGLAASHDDGQSWTYVRGNNWADLAAGRYGGFDGNLTPVPSVLQEDWITSLAEGAPGVLWVGHRDKGYESLWMTDLSLMTSGQGRIRAVAARGDGSVVVGQYGTGAVGTLHAGGDLPAAAFPSSVAAPDENAINKLRDQVNAWQPTDTKVENLTDDWQTKGDWPGRYGARYAELTGSGFGNNAQAADGYAASYCTGPYRPNAAIYTYRTGTGKTDGNEPYCPNLGFRDATEINDGSFEPKLFPQSQEGPDLFIALTLPEGNHRVSIYFLNFDGQHGPANADRDFLLQVKLPGAVAALQPDSNLVDDGPTGDGNSGQTTGRSATDAELAAAIARSRVPQFVEPVFKRFLIRGAGRYWIKIGRNHSFVTKLQGIFVDDEGQPSDAPKDTVQIDGLPAIDLPHPPDDALQAPGVVGAAARLWADLDAAPAKDGYAAACWPMRLAAYRSALAGGADPALLTYWRWRLGIWTADDRQKMDDIINAVSSKHAEQE